MRHAGAAPLLLTAWSYFLGAGSASVEPGGDSGFRSALGSFLLPALSAVVPRLFWVSGAAVDPPGESPDFDCAQLITGSAKQATEMIVVRKTFPIRFCIRFLPRLSPPKRSPRLMRAIDATLPLELDGPFRVLEVVARDVNRERISRALDGAAAYGLRSMIAMRCIHSLFLLAIISACSDPRAMHITSDGEATFTPPAGDDTPTIHAPPSPLANVRLMLAGQDVLDASIDRGGGIWAVSATHVFYFKPGATSPFTYDQGNGLARGWRTWQDTYYSGSAAAPQTFPVSFSAVAGAAPGEAIVGNVGAIADRLAIDPASGAVLRVDNMSVSSAQTGGGEELGEHIKRVVATHTIAVDLNGTYDGTAYVGGWHGFEAFHGLDGDCGCLAFEEHQHFIPGADRNWCDDAGASNGCWGGDVRGLAIAANGDVWAGDRHFLQQLAQRSLGARTGLFDRGVGWTTAVDVFPGVRDELHGLAVDDAGGLWIGSEGNGLAYLDSSRRAVFWSRAHRLPMSTLHGVVVDGSGAVWVATAKAGLARFNPLTSEWRYYTDASGLPSSTINALQLDAIGQRHTLLVATASGLAIFSTDQ
jgi:hypothetical protein